jgi:hypothetical protein
MKDRIALWAAVGLLVASCWFLCASVWTITITAAEPIVSTLAFLTQPILFVSSYFHFGMYFYWVLLANAVTYALIGLIVETLRHQLHHAN